MSFIVPALEQNARARNHFGVCKIPLSIADPGGAPSSGIIRFRGAIARDPAGQPPIVPPGNLMHLFTLPADMRPADERWLTAQITEYIAMRDARAVLCLVRPDGKVLVGTRHINYDGAVYFDGVSFFAEGRRRPPRRRGGKVARAKRR